VAYRGPELEAGPYLRMALEAYKAGNYESAMKAYGQAFKRTRDPNWLVAQGQAAKDAGDAALALKCWDHAVTEDVGLLAAHEARVRMRLELASIPSPASDAQSAALRGASEALLKQKSDHPLAHLALGLALTGLEKEDPNNVAKGIAEMEKAYELAPSDKEVAKSLANVYELSSYERMRKNNAKETADFRKKAEDVYMGMIKADPESASSYMSYAEFLMKRLRLDTQVASSQKKKMEAAQRDAAIKQIDENLKAAEKRQPNSPDLGMLWMQYYDLTGDKEKLFASLEKTIQAVPDYLDAYIELAGRRQREGQLDAAVKVLEASLARPVDRAGYMGEMNKTRRFRALCLGVDIRLSQFRAEQDKAKAKEHLAKAEEWFNQAVAERGGDNWLAKQVEGELREAQGNLRDAQAAYEAADKILRWEIPMQRFQKMQIRLRLAQLYVNQNIPGEALRMLDSVLEYSKGHRAARLMRANVYLRIGKYQEGVDDAKLVLADAKDLGEDSPLIREATLLAMEGYRQLGKTDQLKELQSKLGDKTADDKLRLALVYQAEGDNAKAAEAYKAAVKADPDDRVNLQRAIQFFLLTKQKEEAKKLLQDALAKKPDDSSLKRLNLYLQDDFEKLDPNEREKRELSLINEVADPLAKEVALHEFYLQRNNVAQAMAHLDAARKLKPDSSGLIEREFTLALQQKDWKLADKCWEQAVKLDLDGAGGRFYKGRISLIQAEDLRQQVMSLEGKDLSKAKDLETKAKACYTESAKQLREGIGIYDKSSMAHYWLGTAEEGLGNLIEAREAYTEAVQLNPTNGAAHRAMARMGKTYQNVGDVDRHLKEAIRLTPKGRDGMPLDPWLRAQVESEEEQKDPTKAIAQREEARKKNPKDIYNLMRLALLYEQRKDKPKAEKCVEDALAAEPKNRNLVWDASRYYSRNGQAAKAEKLLHGYVKDVEGEEKGQAQLMVARHYANLFSMMRSEKASYQELIKVQQAADQAYAVAVALKAPVQVYAEAATFCLLTGRTPGAVKWIRDGLEVVKEKDYEASLRRRLIRIMLATRPVPVDTKGEIAQYVDRFKDDPMGLLFRGELFAVQGQPESAIEEYTAYLDQVGRETKAQTRESRLMEGHFLRGQMYLRRARTTYSNRSELLRLAERDLKRAKGTEGEESQNLAPRIALAEVYELMGQPDDAVRELNGILAKQPKATAAARELVRVYAHQKRWQNQETLIRQQMNLFPEDWYWPYVLGTQLDQRGQSAEAIAPLKKACEMLQYRVTEDNGTVQVLRLLLSVLAKTGNNKDLIELFTTKVPKEVQTGETLSYYAGALAKTGKKDEALAQYRKALTTIRMFDDHSRIMRQLGEAFGLKPGIDLLRQQLEKKTDKTELPALMLSTLLAYDNQKAASLELATQAVAAATDPVRKAISLTNQGIILYELGKKEEAAAAYSEALRLKGGDDLTVLNNLAYALADDLKRAKEALPYAERARTLAPNDPSVLDTLGWCLFLAGRSQDAVGILGEAIDKGTTLLDPRIHLAEVLAKEGRKAEADGALRAAMKIATDSGDQGSKDRIAKVMKDLGINP